MMIRLPYRGAFRALLALALCLAPAAMAAPPAANQATAGKPWLYRGSDVPVDTSWTFGVLPNGLRYAVKHNDVPPNQVSIRVRVDAGSLNERPSELGFAHLIEHLTFRGSKYVPDGGAKRVWQRFGATFGSDSNAETTPTQTVFRLDLPDATAASLDESMKILSGMIREPRIAPDALNAERQIVLAEMREGAGPQMDLTDALRRLIFYGQPMADRSPIGDPDDLNRATAPALQAFHDRWYRPDNIVISAAGDVQPAILAGLIEKYFGDWHPAGSDTPAPSFGTPTAAGPPARVIVEPTLPPTMTLAFIRPWRKKNDTIVYNEQQLVDSLALQMINRRLEQHAREGGSYLQANVSTDDVSRSANVTFVSIVPTGDDWRGALDDVRSVIADATTKPPSEADIHRELVEFGNSFQIGVSSYPFEAAAAAADEIVGAVDIRETVATPMVALSVFKAAGPLFTPAHILASTRKLFTGTATRVLLSNPRPVPGGAATLEAALKAPVKPARDARVAVRTVGPDALPVLGPPGTVVDRQPLPGLNMERVTFANGVSVILFPNKGENDKIKVEVRFGRGYAGVDPRNPGELWAGPLALMESGVGALDQSGLDALANGRRLGLGFTIDDDAFAMVADTRPADLDVQLRLFAGKLAAPRWDAAPVLRARAVAEAGYRTYAMSASSILQRDMDWLLRNRDPRFRTPNLSEIAALTPDNFRATWQPLLQTGPIEVLLFGDFNTDAAIRALAATFGALPPRATPPAVTGADVVHFPAPDPTPVVLTHDGPADQAAAVIAWPTGAGEADIVTSRRLEVLADIFKDRLFEGFRSQEAKSYSPYVVSNWPRGLGGQGYIAALAQVQPANVDAFIAQAKAIAADLVAHPVTADELARATRPMVELVTREATGNAFWLRNLEGATRDPRRIAAVRHLVDDYGNVTADELQQLAATYLLPAKAYTIVVEPRGRTTTH